MCFYELENNWEDPRHLVPVIKLSWSKVGHGGLIQRVSHRRTAQHHENELASSPNLCPWTLTL